MRSTAVRWNFREYRFPLSTRGSSPGECAHRECDNSRGHSNAASDSETKLADGLAPTCGEGEITWRWFYKELRECPNAAEVLVEPSSLLATNGATSSTNAGNYARL